MTSSESKSSSSSEFSADQSKSNCNPVYRPTTWSETKVLLEGKPDPEPLEASLMRFRPDETDYQIPKELLDEKRFSDALRTIEIQTKQFNSRISEWLVANEDLGNPAGFISRVVVGKYNIWAQSMVDLVSSHSEYKSIRRILRKVAVYSANAAYRWHFYSRYRTFDPDEAIKQLRVSIVGRLEHWDAEALIRSDNSFANVVHHTAQTARLTDEATVSVVSPLGPPHRTSANFGEIQTEYPRSEVTATSPEATVFKNGAWFKAVQQKFHRVWPDKRLTRSFLSDRANYETESNTDVKWFLKDAPRSHDAGVKIADALRKIEAEVDEALRNMS